MRNWQSDGWTDRDWDRIDATAGDMLAIAAEFDRAVGGGGGGFEPAEVIEFAERLRVIVSRLDDIGRNYT